MTSITARHDGMVLGTPQFIMTMHALTGLYPVLSKASPERLIQGMVLQGF